MNDLVSIIMPSYNNALYIGNSINSILAQTYPNWELIIVDDCSTDESIKVIESYKDERIILYKNEINLGAALSRNRALREAKGKWIAFLDSDDMWDHDKLEKQLSFMIDNGYHFSFTDYRIKLNGQWLPYIYTAPNVINKRKMYNYCYFSTITVMYDREYVGLIQIENIRKNNDYAMWLKIIEYCNAYRLPECLSSYVKHDGSISSGNKLKLIKWHYILFRVGVGKNRAISTILTLRNIFYGAVKKIKYKEKVDY